jgi:shikimate dehydrogenase
MKKYLVIGNPIEHSLSPKLHNFWLKKNNINAVYEKKNIHGDELNDLILEIRKKNINGINVTVPFKNKIIPHLDELSIEAKDTQSVNTIYLKEDKIIGHNTDIAGFELGIKNLNFDIKKKTILILGAGGVVPSIIFALNKMKISEIIISNRTKTNAENLKNMFKNIKIVDWGVIPNFDMIINATSVGLMKDDKIDIDFSEVKKGKFFYDIIYNPKETNFLKKGKEMNNQVENGKMMFIYQAFAAFKIWHGIEPEINKDTIKLLD